ncbi:hypothetical protein C1645_833464 [Glomus cerebriforme]|uniref:Uncharacterized protein n=1 Tax=Glomus cerebriforme TaxID=658196 RepID=A0A397SLG5_9GLOM|nr:hypothetical protein C1645_833464 [Glomus cerebriforme]
MKKKNVSNVLALKFNKPPQLPSQYLKIIKTGILPSYDDDDNVDEKESELNVNNDKIKDLLNHLLESDNVLEYFQIFDHEVLTEENLTDEEIINLVQGDKGDKENQEAEEEDDDDEIPVIFR